MVAISLHIKGLEALKGPRWERLVGEIENLGFAGLYLSNHFTSHFPLKEDSLELIRALTYLAKYTWNIRFGTLIAPFWFRHPSLLAREAAALHDLSGGRMILSAGAGWQERERSQIDLALADDDFAVSQAVLEEKLEVITQLLHSDQPVAYEGG